MHKRNIQHCYLKCRWLLQLAHAINRHNDINEICIIGHNHNLQLMSNWILHIMAGSHTLTIWGNLTKSQMAMQQMWPVRIQSVEVTPLKTLSMFFSACLSLVCDQHGRMVPTSKDSICGGCTAPKNLPNFSCAAFWLAWWSAWSHGFDK